jgi:hypothetical protein
MMEAPALLLGQTWKPETNAYRVLVTPDFAETLLEGNPETNRNQSQRKVLDYAGAMSRGEWEMTHQGIAVDYHGKLLDGQHRLEAIIRSGLPQWIVVFVNQDAGTFDLMDTGWKRTAASLLKGKYNAPVAAASKILMVIEGDHTSAGVTGGRRSGVRAQSPTLRSTLECIQRWPELEDMAAKTTKVYHSARIHTGFHTAVLCVANRTEYRDCIGPWVDGLISGAGLEPTDARLLLRNRYIRDYRLLNNNVSQVQSFGLIVKAWNAFVTDNPVSILKHGLNERLPRVVGYEYRDDYPS